MSHSFLIDQNYIRICSPIWVVKYHTLLSNTLIYERSYTKLHGNLGGSLRELKLLYYIINKLLQQKKLKMIDNVP